MTGWMEGDWPEDIQPEDDRDVMLKRLCRMLRQLSASLPSINDAIDIEFDEIMQVVDEIESYYEAAAGD
jgi:hypothetical protein